MADRRADPRYRADGHAVQWKRNVYLGMVVHCTLNTVSVVLVIVTGQL